MQRTILIIIWMLPLYMYSQTIEYYVSVDENFVNVFNSGQEPTCRDLFGPGVRSTPPIATISGGSPVRTLATANTSNGWKEEFRFNARPRQLLGNGGTCQGSPFGEFELEGYINGIPDDVDAFFTFNDGPTSLYMEKIDLDAEYEVNCNTTSINAPNGLNGIYIEQWEYSFEGNTRAINNSAGLSSIPFSFSAFSIDEDQDIGKTIYFRYRLRYGHYSPLKAYSIVGCPVQLVSIVPSSPRCSYDTGSFVATFDRNLESGETLIATLFNILADGSERLDGQNSTTTLNSGNRYTWPASLEPGTYFLRTDTSGGPPAPPQDSQRFTISRPPPVQFTATKTNDIFCNGGRDGRIALSASGGNGGYEFRLNNGGWTAFSNTTTHTISGLSQGNHTIRVRDRLACTERLANGSDKTISITINEPSALTLATVSRINPSAFGRTDGSISVNIAQGTPAANGSYTVQWRNSANVIVNSTSNRRVGSNYRTTLNNIGDGTYTLTVTDTGFGSANASNNSGCRIQGNYTITQPPAVTVTISTANAISCNGETGRLQANITGGVPNASYTYRWFRVSGGTSTVLPQTSRIISGLGAGLYSVEATDGSGNSDRAPNFNFTEPNPLTFQTSSGNVLCNGGNDGEIIITPSGGTPPYTYNWLDGSTARNRFNLTPGTYFVTITDNNGCEIDNFATGFRITEPLQPLEITTDLIQSVSLRNGTDGRIAISVTGGTPPYSYQWRKQGTAGIFSRSQDLSNLSEGVYTVTVLDDNYEIAGNTNNCVIIREFTITEPELLEVSIDEQPISCFNASDAALTANGTGGVALPNNTYTYEWFREEAGRFVSTEQTTRTVTGLDIGTYRVVINDRNGTQAENDITVTQPLALDLSFTKEDVLCNGGSNGTINLSVSGGTLPYTYTWRNSQGVQVAVTEDLNDIEADAYEVTVTDARDCLLTQNISITEPGDALQISVDSIVNPTAFQATDGSIAVSVFGGTPPYSYEWTDTTNTPIAITEDLTSLGDGNYTLTVTDANFNRTSSNLGCTAFEVVTLMEPELLTVSISERNAISCFQFENGALEANAAGGVAPYSYEWFSLDSGTPVSLNVTDALITNLAVGRYQVQVTDANAIVASNNLDFLEPELLRVANTTVTNIVCFGADTGAIDITITGGTPPYRYFWNTSATTEDISGLQSGSYNVTITDANNCEVRLDDIIVTQPSEAVRIDTSNITNLRGFETNDGAITITPAGGTPPYSYSWVESGTTLVRSSESTVSNLEAGTYQVTVTDANSCSVIEAFEVTQPDPLSVAITQILFNQCFNDTAAALQADVTGGTPPYLYRWYDVNTPNSTLSTFVRLEEVPAGHYGVRITDANAIETTGTLVITEPTPISISTQVENVLCYGAATGAIDVSVTGGTGTYTYQWSNRAVTEDVNGLTAGTYTVSVTDMNNCTSLETVTITQPEVYDITNATLIRPSGDTTDGSITIATTGGIAPFAYQWFDSTGALIQDTPNSTLNTNRLSNIPTGTYTIVITDRIGCIHEDTYNLGNPGQLIADIVQIKPISCHGSGDGELMANSIGGAGGNNFSWFNAETNIAIGTNSPILQDVAAGSYYVIVRDANGLEEQSGVVTVIAPEVLTAVLEGSYTNCGTANDWTVVSQISGGTPPYTFSWNTGDNTATLTNVMPANYFVRIRDAFGCETTANYRITVPEVLEVSANITQVTCANACEGIIQLDITGGIAPYDIRWNTGASTTTLENLCPETYTVIVSDQFGCEIIREFTIDNPEGISVNLGEDRTLCTGQSHTLDIEVEDPDTTYSWTSTNGFTSNAGQVSLTTPGIYTATLTSASGCTGSDSIEIFQSTLGISAQFLVTSQAFAEEDIILINTSNPISEDIQWLIPNEAEIIEENGETLTLRFDIPGAYEIVLRAFEGSCFQDFSKPIIVGEARDLPDVGDTNGPFLLEYTTFPNPTRGVFQVDVKLQEASSISLRLFSLSSNIPVDDRQVHGASTYTIDYDLSLTSGTYFLLLETAKGSQIRKIVIQ